MKRFQLKGSLLFTTCGEHGRRVAVVGAADDGGDDDRPVRKRVFGAVVQKRNQGALLFLRNVEPFETNLIKTDVTQSDCSCLGRSKRVLHAGFHYK